MKKILKCLIESPHAAESGCQRNFRHRHLRLVDQLLGKEHAPRLRHRNRRSSKMLHKQPPKLALAQAKPIRQRFHAVVVLRRSRAPSVISASARETVFEVPRHEARSGAVSGRQRRHGRNLLPAPLPPNRKNGNSRTWPYAPDKQAGNRCRST